MLWLVLDTHDAKVLREGHRRLGVVKGSIGEVFASQEEVDRYVDERERVGDIGAQDLVVVQVKLS